jgi:hypothetical protein
MPHPSFLAAPHSPKGCHQIEEVITMIATRHTAACHIKSLFTVITRAVL